MSTTFNGATIYKPGSYSAVSKDQQTVINPGASRVLAVVGELHATAAGFGTGVLKAYNDPATALTDLKQGDTLSAMQLAWTARPATEGSSADVIFVCEVVAAVPGAPVTSEWTTALDKLKAKKVHGIVVVTSTAAVHGLVKSHVTTMSDTVNKKERRGFVGGATGAIVSASVTAATTLIEQRMTYTHHGVKRYDAAGALVNYPAFVTAALVAGLWAGSDPAEPITFDQINVAGLESELNPTEMDSLLQAGVICFEPRDTGGFRLVQSVTTALTELSVETVVDTITAEIRNMIENKYVGTRGNKNAVIYADVLAKLEDAKTNRQWLADEVDANGNIISPAYQNPVVIQSGKSISVEFFGNVIDPINYVLVKARFKV